MLIVSSSSEDEASYQQELLDRAFDGTRSENTATGHRVLVLSVVDPTSGGQIIGHVHTWKSALPRAREQGVDLVELLRSGRGRIAVYHNGGKGERASPITQGLGNSRGAQSLVGSVRCADGSEIELELLLAVVLQTSSLARTGIAGVIDTYWTSQLIFDTRDPEDMPRTGAPFEKFIVEVNRDRVTAKQLHDFGTALLRKDGTIVKFFGNKQFGRQIEQGGWEVVEDRRADWSGPEYELGFDFGSFRMQADLHLALVDFYDRDDLWRKVEQRGSLEPADARDLDPHVVQPLVALLGGISDPASLPASLPEPAELRERARELDRDGRAELLEPHVAALREALSQESRESLAMARAEGVEEMLGFYVMHRDCAFFRDPARTVGSVRFGAESHWLTYRRPIDMANEKLLMLADLADCVQEILPDGLLASRPADGESRGRAVDFRRLRGISEEQVARFRVGDALVSLSREQVAKGTEVQGVYVKASVIQGECLLLPGSRIEGSVLHHASGRIVAETSYVESVTATELKAWRSFVHKVVSTRALEANAEVVSDAFRVGLEDVNFPPGQTRMRVPIGYDAQARVEVLSGARVTRDEVTKTEGKRYTLAEVRQWPTRRPDDDAVEARLREGALQEMRG
ncbi:MAG: hypothetical protein O7J95_04715 [Planctomycetota bacterium]|nr:hypothetical protein [Planctomycetota bacterium]